MIEENTFTKTIGELNSIPNHIAFILDGNRRWAKANGLTINQGHKKGIDNIKNLFEWCLKYGIKYLSLYCLSIENLNREKSELKFLFFCIKKYLDADNILKNSNENVKIKIIGDNSVLPKDLKNIIEKVNAIKTKKNKLYVNLCIGYGGRNEIINATKNIVKGCVDKKIHIDEINETLFNNYLYTKDFPDVDLLIRTGGDKRISNFLLWQISYAELYFCDKYWPDFNEEQFYLALYIFQGRNRRYGK